MGLLASPSWSERPRRLLQELRDGYSYVRDPHRWEAAIRRAEAERLSPRPAMFQMGDTFVAHPAFEARIRRELTKAPSSLWSGLGINLVVSLLALEQPPSGGWTDVVVPQRPRLRP